MLQGVLSRSVVGTFLIITSLIFTSIPLPSHAIEGGYIGCLGGVNMLQKEHRRHHKIVYKTGYAAGVFGGYGFCNNVRLEGEFFYRRNEIKSFHFENTKVRCGYRSSFSLMANCLYDFDLCYPVTPYLGLGLGADRDKSVIDFPAARLHEYRTWFAMQAILGLSCPICDYTDVAIDYRFHYPLKSQINNTFTLSFKMCF